MGYTTTFEGRFSLDRLPPAETIVRLRQLEDDSDDIEEPHPDSYCQWVLSKDCRHIEWDGGEKFREYLPWLQWIVGRVLIPAGITLSGSVAYSGEDPRDSGVIEVVNGIVCKTENRAIRDDLAELRRFRDFVLASEWSDDILRAWRKTKPAERKS